MSDQDVASPQPGPVVPEPPAGAPAVSPPQASWPAPPGSYAPPAAQPKRSRAWLWWTIGILAVIGLAIGACVFSVVMIADEDIGGTTSFGGESVAVIRIDAVIAGTGDYYSGYVTPEYFDDQLQQALEDDSVKAIVLRVDSPGGTVAASEEIAEYVKDCDKPVVVSIGDVGASGAYMVSSQADEIWAMPGSTVGSIGVIAEIPNVASLLDKVGVEFTVITAGKHKDAGSPYRPMTAEERALIQGSVDESYDQFIDIVAEGRDMPRSKVETLATGWAWGGTTAKKLGLVDKIGTYEDALDSAADRGGIKGDYDVVNFESDFGSPLDLLLGLTGKFSGADAISEARAGFTRRSLPR